MIHTFLSLDMSLITQTTKDNVPTFYSGMFSNDNSRMLIDGRNASGEMVHPISSSKSYRPNTISGFYDSSFSGQMECFKTSEIHVSTSASDHSKKSIEKDEGKKQVTTY